MNFCAPKRHSERGYILLTLMLFVALLTIGALALVQNIEFQIKRDREEELIHRGVQYSRAVQHFYRKFGRYPNSIADLENTNNYRSLRKRYKDPINRDPATGKERDFKPLHMTDVQMALVGGAGPPPVPGPVNPGDQSGSSNSTDQSTQPVPPGQAQSNDSGPAGAQVFGGGAIVGVASTSKDKTIREFNKKDHYNQWQFIYDPNSNRNGLLTTPNQPPLKGAVPIVDQGTNTPTPPGPNPGPGPGPPGPNPQPPDQ